jgi:shikimate dehydrogenase
MPLSLPHPYHFALTGNPLGHSLSPQIHNAALRACGLQGEYVLRPVPPETLSEGLSGLVRDLRTGTLHGFNVTIPHKQAILPYCDRLTPAAQAMGAANLIFLENGAVVGDNSDARGFLAALQGFENKDIHKAIVLGAGGSARAVVYGLASQGWQLLLSARRSDQAEALIQQLVRPLKAQGSAIPFPVEKDDLQGVDLIVNTTPLGMHPHPKGCPWQEGMDFPPGAVVYDLVYNPRLTSLLQRAEASGLRTIGGIQMLVEQAAIAFEQWTGRSAPREAMYQAVA